MPQPARDTVLRFVDAINRHDPAAIAALMADDHVFIDAHGGRESRVQMLEGWPGYFAWFPDYRIEVEQVMEDETAVAIFGFAGGTYQNLHTADGRFTWRLPAAWRAEARDGKVTVWQVYCDSKIPYEIIARGEREA